MTQRDREFESGLAAGRNRDFHAEGLIYLRVSNVTKFTEFEIIA